MLSASFPLPLSPKNILKQFIFCVKKVLRQNNQNKIGEKKKSVQKLKNFVSCLSLFLL